MLEIFDADINEKYKDNIWMIEEVGTYNNFLKQKYFLHYDNEYLISLNKNALYNYIKKNNIQKFILCNIEEIPQDILKNIKHYFYRIKNFY